MSSVSAANKLSMKRKGDTSSSNPQRDERESKLKEKNETVKVAKLVRNIHCFRCAQIIGSNNNHNFICIPELVDNDENLEGKLFCGVCDHCYSVMDKLMDEKTGRSKTKYDVNTLYKMRPEAMTNTKLYFQEFFTYAFGQSEFDFDASIPKIRRFKMSLCNRHGDLVHKIIILLFPIQSGEEGATFDEVSALYLFIDPYLEHVSLEEHLKQQFPNTVVSEDQTWYDGQIKIDPTKYPGNRVMSLTTMTRFSGAPRNFTRSVEIHMDLMHQRFYFGNFLVRLVDFVNTNRIGVAEGAVKDERSIVCVYASCLPTICSQHDSIFTDKKCTIETPAPAFPMLSEMERLQKKNICCNVLVATIGDNMNSFCANLFKQLDLVPKDDRGKTLLATMFETGYDVFSTLAGEGDIVTCAEMHMLLSIFRAKHTAWTDIEIGDIPDELYRSYRLLRRILEPGVQRIAFSAFDMYLLEPGKRSSTTSDDDDFTAPIKNLGIKYERVLKTDMFFGRSDINRDDFKPEEKVQQQSSSSSSSSSSAIKVVMPSPKPSSSNNNYTNNENKVQRVEEDKSPCRDPTTSWSPTDNVQFHKSIGMHTNTIGDIDFLTISKMVILEIAIIYN